jgi:hypothetical protein
MQEVSQQLSQVTNYAEPRLRAFSGLETTKPLLRGGWSRKQVIGHLIDSASNNHQRFVRAALQTTLDFPAYDQDGFVSIQAVQEADWPTLVGVWTGYSSYLVHVIARLPAAKLNTVCRIGENEPVTLSFLAIDYVAHVIHHLKQIGAVP